MCHPGVINPIFIYYKILGLLESKEFLLSFIKNLIFFVIISSNLGVFFFLCLIQQVYLYVQGMQDRYRGASGFNSVYNFTISNKEHSSAFIDVRNEPNYINIGWMAIYSLDLCFIYASIKIWNNDFIPHKEILK